jgi:hypothetical protein
MEVLLGRNGANFTLLYKGGERRPQIRRDSHARIAKNFHVVGSYDAIFTILLRRIQVEANSIKITGVRAAHALGT